MQHVLDRGCLLRGLAAGLAVGATVAPGMALAAYGTGPSYTPDQAIKKLMAGNANFVAGSLHAPGAVAERRMDNLTSQRPFAAILSCADSRLPPEHVFDQSVGDLFVCRVAGSVLEPAALGSFEYAVATFKSPAVLIVLGHQRCGAVNAACSLVKSGKTAPGSIQTIIDELKPAIEATPRDSMTDADYADAVSKVSAKMVAKSMLEQSEILRKAVAAHTLKVTSAYYHLDTGKVSLLT